MIPRAGHDPDDPDVELSRADDAELLRAYVVTRSPRALGQIVERHISVVRSAALRQCGGDPNAADDVTQSVFLLLVHKASSIGAGTLLAGWLVRAAYFCACSQRRAERRRRRSEARAAALRDREGTMRPTEGVGPDPDRAGDLWKRVAPLLDEALVRLPAAARDVLTLRFLEGRRFADAGARLGISEEAARKRAARGLSALRDVLARRGIHTYEEALETALASAVAAPVPVAIARLVASGAAAGQYHTLIFKGALNLMAWTKAKATAAGLAAALLVGGTGVAAYRVATSGQGSAPARATRLVALPDNATRPGAQVTTAANQINPANPAAAPATSLLARGKVRKQSGEPAAGARVLVSSADGGEFLELNPDPSRGVKPPPASQQTTTDQEGYFELPLSAPAGGALVLGDDGAVAATAEELAGNAPLVLRPYARIEGTFLADHKPVPAGDVLLTMGLNAMGSHAREVRLTLRSRTDGAGRLMVDRVPAGQYAATLADANGVLTSGEITVSPGSRTEIHLDQVGGIPLAGRLGNMNGRDFALFYLRPAAAPSTAPSPVGVFVPTAWQFNTYLPEDGRFKLAGFPPGLYHLSVSVLKPGRRQGFAEREVEIPPVGRDLRPAPVDIGTLNLGQPPGARRGGNAE